MSILRMMKKFLKIIHLFLFLRFWFLPNDPSRCETLVHLIQEVGVVAIKAAQWYYNIFCFKYTDKDRPLFLQSLSRFQKENQFTALDDTSIRSIMERVPLIAEISPIPIASGSIAQVHRCRGHDDDKTEYVIKIRHPTVRDDVACMKFVLAIMSLFHQGHLTPLLQCILNQTDMTKEGSQSEKLRDFYSHDRHMVRIPNVMYASPDLLLMEYIPIDTNGDDVNDPTTVICLLSWVLDQIINKPLFHADLHYGNWGYNSIENYIAVYDFGIVLETETVRPFAVSIIMRDREMCRTALGRCIQWDDIPQEKFNAAWNTLEKNRFVLSLEVLQSFMSIVACTPSINIGILNTFSFLLGMVAVDKITNLQETSDWKELHKHQHIILSRLKFLPEMRAFLLKNIFCTCR